MTNTNHTPTPWRLTDNAIESTVAYLIEPNPAEGEPLGIPLTVINLTGAMGGEDGDAEFIVRAVNSHEKLIAALAYTIRNAVANGSHWPPDIVAWAESMRHTHPDNVTGGDLVRAAIAEAV